MSEDASLSWPACAGSIMFAPGEVHVWASPLSVTEEALQVFWGLLSADERSRADRFRFPRDRGHFIVAHGLLRKMMGHYLKTEPHLLQFRCGPKGKPELAPSGSQHNLQFNLSHSGELVLFAFTLDRRVGVDVEKIRYDFEPEEIAKSFFSRRETSTLLSLRADQRFAAFFNCWTRKEAYIKGTGDGLSTPLDQFDVSLVPGDPAALLCDRSAGAKASNWTLHDLIPCAGYAAALAIENTESTIKRWSYQP